MVKTHNELGRELELFDTYEEAGAGHIFWKPRGYKIYSNLMRWIEFEHKKRGYHIIRTPMIFRSHLWERSGHKQMYGDMMYLFEIKKQDLKEEWGIKPMNCPAHIILYKSERRSEKSLPLKFFELGFVHRHELSGVLNGLLRVRSFMQDDAHIFVKKDQIAKEISNVIDFIEYVFELFDLKDRKFYLSTMPEKHLGDEETWRLVEKEMEKALRSREVNYEIAEGEGAFYGPKIDVEVKDNLGRYWQLSTVQLDFNLPERFDVNYYDGEGKKHRVYLIHRAVLGSLERFIGVLLEHYEGKLPLLFAPYQIAILPIVNTETSLIEYAKEIKRNIERSTNLLVEVDVWAQDKTLNKRIREAERKKYVYILVVGEKELKNNEVNVRGRGNIKIDELYDEIEKEIQKWYNY